jgi:molybdopterin synthase sulfur carrier subunit
MAAIVRIPTPLRRVTNGADVVNVPGGSLKDVLDSLEKQYPGVKARIVDGTGELHRFVNIYVNTEDVRFMGGLDTAIKDGDEVSIVPAVAGGAR